jgi:hypothetical protein
MKLSDQAIGALMMAVQKGMMAVANNNDEDVDITKTLKEFDLENTINGLVVENPPTISFSNNNEEE